MEQTMSLGAFDPLPASDGTRRKEAEAALEQRVAQQAAVAALGQTALVQTSIDTLMHQAVHCVADTLRTEFAKVLQLTPAGGELLLRAGVGWTPGLVGRATVGADRESQAGFTLLTDRPVVVTDLRTETRFTGPPLLVDHGVVSGMSCAIRGLDDRPYGVLGTHTRSRREFSDDDVNFLRSVANMLPVPRDRAGRGRHCHRLVTRKAGQVRGRWA